jgi:MFS family permease
LLTFTLLGDAAISLWLSTHADRWGRRKAMMAGAALMIAGGAAMAVTGNFGWLLVAATIGVISPTGNEVGPFLAVEQACLAQVIADRHRTRIFAWYNVAGYAATALGALAGRHGRRRAPAGGLEPARQLPGALRRVCRSGRGVAAVEQPAERRGGSAAARRAGGRPAVPGSA